MTSLQACDPFDGLVRIGIVGISFRRNDDPESSVNAEIRLLTCIAYGFRNTDDLIALCLLCQGRELPSRDLRRAAAVTLDGVALGDIGVSDIAGTSGAQNWNVRGADFSKTFVLNASIEVAGAGFVGNEALRFQATVGCAP